MKIHKIFWLLLLLLCSCGKPPITSEPVRPIIAEPDKPIEKDPVSIRNEKLLQLHNTQRNLKGRPNLELDPYLCEYAQKHADWMASANRLKHSNISNLMDKYYTAGENIAWNQQNEEEVVDGWMHSSGHRANILNRGFTKVGFALQYNKSGEPYWCTCFGG